MFGCAEPLVALPLAIPFGLCEHLHIVASKLVRVLGGALTTNNWGYRELADALGVTLSQAHGWATGSSEPNLKNLRRIAKRLRRSVEELV